MKTCCRQVSNVLNMSLLNERRNSWRTGYELGKRLRKNKTLLFIIRPDIEVDTGWVQWYSHTQFQPCSQELMGEVSWGSRLSSSSRCFPLTSPRAITQVAGMGWGQAALGIVPCFQHLLLVSSRDVGELGRKQMVGLPWLSMAPHAVAHGRHWLKWGISSLRLPLPEVRWGQ